MSTTNQGQSTLTLKSLMFVHQLLSIHIFLCIFLWGADRWILSGSRFSADSRRYGRTVSPKLSTVKSPKPSPAAPLRSWLIINVRVYAWLQQISRRVYSSPCAPSTRWPSLPPAPTQVRQQLAFPPCGAAFLGQDVSSVAGGAFAPTQSSWALRLETMPYCVCTSIFGWSLPRLLRSDTFIHNDGLETLFIYS